MTNSAVYNDNPGEGKKSKGNFNKLLKNKWFLVACAVVALLGLVALIRRQQAMQSDNGQNMLLADGVSGLTVTAPPVDAYDGSAYSSGTFDAMYHAFESQLADIKDSYDIQVDDMKQQMTLLSERYDTASYILQKQSAEIAKQNDLQAMMNNSDAWHFAETPARKQALQNANIQIASKYDWIFDDGVCYDTDGRTPLYTTSTQEYMNTSGTASKKASSTVNKTSQIEKDISTVKTNSLAWHTADTNTKTNLQKANQEIAKKYNWTLNTGDGHYYDSKGKKVY